MIDKKKLLIPILITALMLCLVNTSMALDKTKNQTIELNGVKIAVPESDQGKITNISSDGVWTYTYSDEKNKITIYVSDADMPEYKLYAEEWNEYEGYTQMRPVGDKWVMVGSEYEENKDFMYDSLAVLNPDKK